MKNMKNILKAVFLISLSSFLFACTSNKTSNGVVAFTHNMIIDKTEYEPFVSYYLKEVNIVITVPGKTNVILGDGVYKGGNKIEDVPQLMRNMIETRRNNGALFLGFDFGLNFEIYHINTNVRITTGIEDVLDSLIERYRYEFVGEYENKNEIKFFEFKYFENSIEGKTYFTTIKGKSIQINFQAAKVEVEREILDSLKWDIANKNL
jgi:hypothetical protein